ncbi:hypothetical protein J1N35_003902 [Gossypium stocksii]|uniref:Uncharacterized protein n=1 Tax=Gossypium stocksii TaxID=47602 RepID=A0A9D3WBS2_9ROSI|nr:hypothetical protein J1N35_003902 [Gossypium stocksii]
MARLTLVLVIGIVVLAFHPTCFEAGKLLNNFEKQQVPSFKGNFVGITLAKEPTKMLPASDDKGHAMANNERLFAIHLAKIDRMLQTSPPSPGNARKLLNNFEKQQIPSFKGNFAGITLFKEPTKMLPASDDGKGHAKANNGRQSTIHNSDLVLKLPKKSPQKSKSNQRTPSFLLVSVAIVRRNPKGALVFQDGERDANKR